MSFLLDTNVVSEWVKPRPEPNVREWLAEVDEDTVWLSVITFAEIRLGIDRMPPGRRRTALGAWLENDLPARFEGRIIGIGLGIADAWGKLMARCARQGRTVGAMNGFIGAIALAQGFTLVTRNTEDFAPLGIPVLNPWPPYRWKPFLLAGSSPPSRIGKLGSGRRTLKKVPRSRRRRARVHLIVQKPPFCVR